MLGGGLKSPQRAAARSGLGSVHFLMGHLGKDKAKELRGDVPIWPGRGSLPGINFCESSISTHWTVPFPCSKSYTKCKTLASSQAQSPTMLPLPPFAPATRPFLLLAIPGTLNRFPRQGLCTWLSLSLGCSSHGSSGLQSSLPLSSLL